MCDASNLIPTRNLKWVQLHAAADDEVKKMTTENPIRVQRKFGDEHSSLFDQYERSAFEVQLNEVILGRSFSEPTMARFRPSSLLPPHHRPHPHHDIQTRRPSSSSKLLKTLKKMLIKPIMMSKKKWQRSKGPDGNDQQRHEYACKPFTRSLSRFNFESNDRWVLFVIAHSFQALAVLFKTEKIKRLIYGVVCRLAEKPSMPMP
ncbi:hypothetical protein ACLOJK_031467 [Asimina triloba]